ncbi:fido domain-containing protein [Mycena floridula]|nr:fido domain-containing protein [Mycena floridula]
MENARFGISYTPPGVPRNVTRKPVVIDTESGYVECCPYFAVEGELYQICNETLRHLKRGVNPFALASWLHLVLARSHPFDNGNGRITRFVASLPLLVNGYPPMTIPLSACATYHHAINQAYHGNHASMIDCIFDGMRTTLEKVQTQE